MRFNIKLLNSPHTENYVISKRIPLVLHYFSQACMGCSSKLNIMLASLVLMSTYKTLLKEDAQPMSFGFNVRCCTVVESYTIYVFYPNIEFFTDRSLFM